MNYFDNIATLDRLLSAIDKAVQDKVKMDNSCITNPHSHYIIDKNNGGCTDITEIIYSLDQKLEKLSLKPKKVK